MNNIISSSLLNRFRFSRPHTVFCRGVLAIKRSLETPCLSLPVMPAVSQASVYYFIHNHSSLSRLKAQKNQFKTELVSLARQRPTLTGDARPQLPSARELTFRVRNPTGDKRRISASASLAQYSCTSYIPCFPHSPP